MTERFTLHHGDCLEVLRGLDDCSVDAIVTDPPAGIAFMSRDWDKDKGGRTEWIAWMREIAAECLRVIKPGGHALVWAIPRTSHWTGTAWEDAGWQPRDKVYHVFGSGFPKSLDVSKAIDKAAGAEREVVGYKKFNKRDSKVYTRKVKTTFVSDSAGINDKGLTGQEITTPATDAAKQWQGWGTALKPAAEEWWLFRKPLTGTVAANVLEWGTGGLNVDGCRVACDDKARFPSGIVSDTEAVFGGGSGRYADRPRGDDANPQGRWPANFTHDGSDEVVGLFPDAAAKRGRNSEGTSIYGNAMRTRGATTPNDTGSAARFFYCAKASRADRNEGLENAPDAVLARSCQAAAEAKRGNTVEQSAGAFNKARIVKNNHPTVKPTSLMRWLCRLITPPGGVVLDPFTGSGSTGKAAMLEGLRFIGIERESEYIEIARARISHAADEPQQSDLFS